MHAATKAAILATGLLDPATRLRDINMLAEMVAYGDSGAFTDKVCAVLCCAVRGACVGGLILGRWGEGSQCQRSIVKAGIGLDRRLPP